MRHHWLQGMTQHLAPLLEEAGHALPADLRVATSFPDLRPLPRSVGGRCDHATETPDGSVRVRVAPDFDDGVMVAEILLHELAHAALGPGFGHGPAFRKLALSLGLVGPMRSTLAGPALRSKLEAIVEGMGPYPAP